LVPSIEGFTLPRLFLADVMPIPRNTLLARTPFVEQLIDGLYHEVLT
jgi:hypothetical protein